MLFQDTVRQSNGDIVPLPQDHHAPDRLIVEAMRMLVRSLPSPSFPDNVLQKYVADNQNVLIILVIQTKIKSKLYFIAPYFTGFSYKISLDFISLIDIR